MKQLHVLISGETSAGPLNDEINRVTYNKKRDITRRIRGKAIKKSKEWILQKKERSRRQGKDTREDTKYTGRKRAGRF